MGWKIVIESDRCEWRERLDCAPGPDFFYCYKISKECTEKNCPLKEKEKADEK